jgi:hypothetical protein
VIKKCTLSRQEVLHEDWNKKTKRGRELADNRRDFAIGSRPRYLKAFSCETSEEYWYAGGTVLYYQGPTNRVSIHESLCLSTRGVSRSSNLRVSLCTY